MRADTEINKKIDTLNKQVHEKFNVLNKLPIYKIRKTNRTLSDIAVLQSKLATFDWMLKT